MKFAPGLDLFYAEPVWEQIARLGELDALQMEGHLAKLADLVIIIVESAGTLTELGAFSLSDPLRRKLLPIVDERYRGDTSFIANGPLKWIDKESDFKPTIYVGLDIILDAAKQIEDRLKLIPKSKTIKLSDLAESPKHLLFFICDLISVIYPATMEMISYYVEKISPTVFASTINVPTLVGLAVAMNLLRAHTLSTKSATDTFYSPYQSAAANRPFHHSRLLYLENQRAAHYWVLTTIPAAMEVMGKLPNVA